MTQLPFCLPRHHLRQNRLRTCQNRPHRATKAGFFWVSLFLLAVIAVAGWLFAMATNKYPKKLRF